MIDVPYKRPHWWLSHNARRTSGKLKNRTSSCNSRLRLRESHSYYCQSVSGSLNWQRYFGASQPVKCGVNLMFVLCEMTSIRRYKIKDRTHRDISKFCRISFGNINDLVNLWGNALASLDLLAVFKDQYQMNSKSLNNRLPVHWTGNLLRVGVDHRFQAQKQLKLPRSGYSLRQLWKAARSSYNCFL